MITEITINNHSIKAKEYNGIRVITFKDIDLVHNRPDGTARKRFHDNKNHFIEGIDYFVRKTDEAKREYGIVAPNGLVLITESGYLMLVKSLSDALAWKVQRMLVEQYFHTKEDTANVQFVHKYWHGEPVVTLKDISDWAGKDKHPTYQIRYFLQHFPSIRLNQDYYLLMQDDISEFKMENPAYPKGCNKLVLVNQSGLKKIIRLLNIQAKKSELLFGNIREQSLLDAPKISVCTETEYVQIPDSPEIVQQIESIKNKTIALEVLLDLLNRHDYTKQLYQSRLQAITSVSAEIFRDVMGLEDFKPIITYHKKG